MTKFEVDFETWFDALRFQIFERTGIQFRDEDSVIGDYDSGADVNVIADDISAEYGER